MRKSLDEIRKEGGGRVNRAKVDSATGTDIDHMAEEDREEEVFPKAQRPTRVSRPYEPAK